MTNPQVGVFDRDLGAIYQSDADFELSIKLWNMLPGEVVCMTGDDLAEAERLLPKVSKESLKIIKTKCSKGCECGRVHNALDLIKFSLNDSIHGEIFLTSIFNETRKDKKISIIDSSHKKEWLPKSVVYLDDTKDIPCCQCGHGVHLYLLHTSLAHYWNGGLR